MKNVNILPADTYSVINKTIITDVDKKIVSMLYQPIIGFTAVSLYYSLISDLEKSELISDDLTHYHLMANMQLSLEDIMVEREKLEVRPRKLNLNSSSIITTINYTHKEVKEINTINNSDHNNKETINNNNLNNNFSEINETPKFSNKKRYRGKNDSSTGVKTCPTTNSSNRLKKAVPVVNKNIKKKKLNLN